MAITTGDLLCANAEYANGEERGMNVHYFRVSAVIDSDEDNFIEGLIAQLVIDMEAAVQSYAGLGTTLVCVTCRRVPPGSPTRLYTKFGGGVPSPRGHMDGAQLSVLFSKYPESGAEPKQGRTYWPFPSTDISDDGQIDPSNQVGMLSQFGKWLADPLVLSTLGTVLPALVRVAVDAEPTISSLVDNLVLRPVLATIRGRVKHHQPFKALNP